MRAVGFHGLKSGVRRGLVCAAWILLAAIAAGPARAVTHEQIEQFRSMPDGSRLRVLINIIDAHETGSATELLAAAPFEGPLAANRTRFVQALIKRAEGDPAAAVDGFRAVLADNPKLTVVRQELAVTLMAMGETDSAKHHLELLMAEAPDQQAASQIKSFIDQIDAQRPYRISAYLSLAPSTNVNGGTKHEVIYTALGVPLTPDNVEESGVGLSAGLNAGYTKDLDGTNALVFGAGAHARLFEESDYNQLTLSETAELRHNFEMGYLGLGAIASQTFTGQHHDLGVYTFGPRVSALLRPTQKASIQSISTLEFNTYPDMDVYDGYSASQLFNATYGISQSTVAFGTLGFEYTKTELDNLDSNAYIVGGGIYHELPMGISVTLDGRLRFTDYLDDWVIIQKPRHDVRYDASVTLAKRDWNLWGYAPELSYSYSRNDSNVEIYETESHTVDLRLTKDF